MHAIVVCWQRVSLTTVRAELGHLQRLACVSTTGTARAHPTAVLESCI
jgi:hypothetical protein